MKRREFRVLSIRPRQMVLVSVFTSLYIVFRYIPTFPMYGFPGSQFRASDFLAPLYGILLGPWLSVPCIVVGTVVNYAFFPSLFLGLDFMPGIVAAVSAGFLSRGKAWATAGIYLAVLVTFVSLPLSTDFINLPGGYTMPLTWLHIIGFLLLISPFGFRAAKWIEDQNGTLLIVATIVITLSATLAQHLMGGILTILIRFPIIGITTPSAASVYWSAIFILYPVERMIITLAGGTLGVSLLRVLKSSGYRNTLGSILSSRLSREQQR